MSSNTQEKAVITKAETMITKGNYGHEVPFSNSRTS